MLKNALMAALLVATPFAAQAATINDGTYSATDHRGKVGMWIPNIISSTDSGTTTYNTNYTLSGTTFVVDGAQATLNGSAKNTLDSNLAFNFQMQFKLSTAANSGYCQFEPGAGGQIADPGCGSAYSLGLIANGDVTPSDWDFFNLTSGTFTGTDLLAGVTYDIVDKSAHLPQVGIGGNGKDIDQLGMAMWFDYTRTDTLGTSMFGDYEIASMGRGDVIVDLAQMPLPAAGWLLIAGLGGMAIAGRRKKTA